MKRIVCLMLTLLLLLTTMGTVTACGGAGNNVDSTKAKLKVGAFTGALGENWLPEVIADFERDYANYDFGNGLKGVEVEPVHKKDEFTSSQLAVNMPYYGIDVYFLDSITYSSYASSKIVADITEAINEKVYDDNGDMAYVSGKPATQSITDIMYDNIDAYYQYIDGKFYGIPNYMSTGGITYDADLFHEKRLFLLPDGTPGANYDDIKAGNCSTGPDAKIGTSDDGLPNTWADFMNLVDYMPNVNVTPFVFSDAEDYQEKALFMQIWANYEGEDDFLLNYTFNGDDSQFGPITNSNAYLLQQQEGRKAGLKAAQDILSNPRYYHGNIFGGTIDYLGAQKTYVESAYKDGEQIAFILERSYWESEARPYLNDLELAGYKGYGERNYRILATPRFDSQTSGITPQTSTDMVLPFAGCVTMTCVSANTKNKELAELFLQYAHSRHELFVFTKHTACIKPYNYKINDEEKQQLTKLTESIYTYIEEGYKVVTDIPISSFKRQYETELSFWDFYMPEGNGFFMNPIKYFHKHGDSSLETAFNVLTQKYSETFWNKLIDEA